MIKPNVVVSASCEGEMGLANLLEIVSRQLAAGEEVDLPALCREHPSYADELSKLLPTIQQMARLESVSRDRTWPIDARRLDALDGDSPVIGTLGDYEILGELGRGGMGVVYRARQKMLGREVAVKVLPMAALADRHQLARFRNEVRATATLHHPHIVPIHTVGVERGIHYYAMQYIDGPTLDQIIHRLKIEDARRCRGSEAVETAPPSAGHDTRPDLQNSVATERSKSMSAYCRTVARWGLQAAQALAHAHENGVVHRDIKPSNLFVDDSGSIWVADFGLARLEAGPSMTQTGDVVGTLRYMAPEQALGKPVVVDHRADIYSLGATLYELITLHPVFDGSDRQSLLNQIASDEPLPLHRLQRAVPRDLETIVLKAIAKEPEDRYQSADEMARDLEAFLQARPIVARRPNAMQRLHRFVRRRPGATLQLCVLGLCLVLAAGWAMGSHGRRVQVATEMIESRLAEARSALDAGEMEAAQRAVIAAQSRIAVEDLRDLRPANDVAKIDEELKRYEEFSQLYKSARRRRDGSERPMQQARRALSLYRVLQDPSWHATLATLTSTGNHANRIREAAYELLLSVAHENTLLRGRFSDKSPEDKLQLLEEAQSLLDRAKPLRAPTKGYYWIRATCFQKLPNFSQDVDRDACVNEALRLRQLADQTAPQNAAELFYIDLDHRWGSADYRHGPPFGREYSAKDRMRALREMLRIEPDYYNALFFMGMRHVDQKNFEAAMVAFHAVLAQNPDDWTARQNLAGTYHNLGLLDECYIELCAVADHHRNCDRCRDAGSHKVLKFFGHLSDDFADKERDLARAVEVAEAGFSRSLALHGAAQEPAPYLANVLVRRLGRQFDQEGDADALIDLRSRLEPLAKEHAEYRAVLAHLLFVLTRTEDTVDDERWELVQDAVDTGRNLVSQSPEDPKLNYYVSATLGNYGSSLMKFGLPQEAERLLVEAVALARDSLEQDGERPERRARLGNILSNLAECQVQLGKMEQAIASCRESVQVYEKLVEEHPDVEEHAQSLQDVHKKLADLISRVLHDNDAAASKSRSSA